MAQPRISRADFRQMHTKHSNKSQGRVTGANFDSGDRVVIRNRNHVHEWQGRVGSKVGTSGGDGVFDVEVGHTAGPELADDERSADTITVTVTNSTSESGSSPDSNTDVVP